MSDGKRIPFFLNHNDYADVLLRAERAGMTVTGYIRHLARGRMPEPKDREHVTAGLAVLATALKKLKDEKDDLKLRPGIEHAHAQATEILEKHLRKA